MNIPRLLRTVRFLKVGQLLDQGTTRLFIRRQNPGKLLKRLPSDGEMPELRWSPRGAFLHPDGSPTSESELLAGRFTFVGETRRVGFPPTWSGQDASRLWRYNLHYHGFLFGLDFERARTVLADYLERHPPASGAEGWETYPLSLRLTCWIPAFFGRWREQTLADRALAERLWLEVRRMAVWIDGHLETHLRANHLLENAIALCLAGACFEGSEAAAWRRRGQALLEGELREQILSDGGHFERSPMYQQRLLYGLGLLLNSGDSELEKLCREPARRMASWLQAMTHPDGGIALFNDAALDVYPRTADLLSWLAGIGLDSPPSCSPADGPPDLSPSGYFSARNDRGDVLFMDVGEIGPTYQPGHAHADFLAIELSLASSRFVVDGGNHDYEPGADRQWARSVQAHSTIFIDGQEPLELWSTFRVGRRGKPTLVGHRGEADGTQLFTGSHTGYQHLPGNPRPRREVLWTARGLVYLRDSVHSNRISNCTSQLRIDGAWQLETVADDRLSFTRDGQRAWVLAGGPIERSPCQWFPHFGVRRGALLLRQATRSGPAPTPTEWVICRDEELEEALFILDASKTGTAA
jgi:uncharacterized heparinase superfamily protein